MKAWIFSDLHIEIDASFSPLDVPKADVCICAGDILDGGPIESIGWLAHFVAPHMMVVFVPGNHEYYRSSIKEGRANAHELANRFDNLFLLDGDSIILGDYCFIGATLWTDFNLYHDPRLAMSVARDELNDYRRIKYSKRPFKKFFPEDSLNLHRQAATKIDSLSRSNPLLPTVIISHHAPSLMSVPQEFLRNGLTPAFASSFESGILEYEPLLWVHGHIHSPSDYYIGKTRVICNPLGYPGEPSRETFIPNLVVDLAKLALE